MTYWSLYYHVVWATKRRSALVLPEFESEIHSLIASKATGLEGHVFALNGMPDHIHLVVSIPPSISIARFVGQVKAVTAVRFNKGSDTRPPLRWQEEYAVFSLDKKRLGPHCEYVQSQKLHHQEGSVIASLELSGQPRRGAAP
jgi:putative transposase